MNNPSLYTNFAAILVLLVTIKLVFSNLIFNSTKTRYYVLTAFIVMAELVLEIAYIFINGGEQPFFRVMNHIDNTLTLILMPAAVLAMLFLHNERLLRFRWWLAVPFFANAAVLLLNLRFGWIYTLSADNFYTREFLYFIPAAVTMCYFLVLMISDFYTFRKSDRDEYIVLVCVYFLPLFGAALQVIFNMLIIWLCTTLSILLYYVFLREREFKFDKLTQVRNRASFIKEMNAIERGTVRGDIHIGVFDINNLKQINDVGGHGAGDEAIRAVADLLNSTFGAVGNIFRTGGDEFCVLVRNLPDGNMTGLAETLEIKSEALVAGNNIRIHFACGYSCCRHGEEARVYNYYSEADTVMYADKKLKKEKY